MKTLSKVGLILAILCGLFAIYIQFVIVPTAAKSEFQMELMDIMDGGGGEHFSMEAHEQVVNSGMILMLAAGISFLVCLIPTFKKNKLAIIGLIISLAAFFVGAAHGSHMFS